MKLAKQMTVLLAVLLICGLTACGRSGNRRSGSSPVDPTDNTFVLRVDCQSREIRKISYSYYAGEERRGCGGMASPDEEIIGENGLTLVFGPSQFDGEEDLAGFSIDFSLYGEDGREEQGVTNRLTFPAAYGKGYDVRITGDRRDGFVAEVEKPTV